MRAITPVPRLPREVRGVISLRGEIVEVVDLRMRLGLAEVEPARRSRIIVVHNADGGVARLLVDAVNEVLSVTDEALRASIRINGDAAGGKRTLNQIGTALDTTGKKAPDLFNHFEKLGKANRVSTICR